MTSAERIQAGFETGTGTDFYTTSPASYSDGQWHYAVVTYDGSTAVRLYIDGLQVSSYINLWCDTRQYRYSDQSE